LRIELDVPHRLIQPPCCGVVDVDVQNHRLRPLIHAALLGTLHEAAAEPLPPRLFTHTHVHHVRGRAPSADVLDEQVGRAHHPLADERDEHGRLALHRVDEGAALQLPLPRRRELWPEDHRPHQADRAELGSRRDLHAGALQRRSCDGQQEMHAGEADAGRTGADWNTHRLTGAA